MDFFSTKNNIKPSKKYIHIISMKITGNDLGFFKVLKIKKDLLSHGRLAATIEIKSSNQINITNSLLLLTH
tara:strand:+ start:380 stop:592 length:213 start_codon:yes stop_codon:yes gene_type:complete